MSARRPTMQTSNTAAAAVPRMALLTRELAESLGVSERTVAGWVAEGTAPPSFHRGRLRLFPVAAVQAWLLDQARAAAELGDDAKEALTA
jgi:excisionase family DNA binding protein